MIEIPIKTKEEIEIMARAGKILALILNEIKKEVKPGVILSFLNDKANELIKKNNVKPAFLGHEGYPATLCTSINDVVVHGLPNDYILKEGDILSLDIGIEYQGYFSDMAITLPIGKVDDEKARLIRVTKKALKRGIKKMTPWNTLGDVSNTMQRYIEKRGFAVIKELCGHGIGKDLHEPPEILNYGERKTGPALKEGMVLCIEPMVSMGNGKIKQNPDRFSFATQDGSVASHFEHTVLIVKDGARVLTE